MDLYKIFLYLSAIILLHYISENEVEGGKKRRRKFPVKPVFGIGIGYRKVVQYKPVLLFQKHKHYKPRYRHHGWGGWGWSGWRAPIHHGHGGGAHGHGGGAHGHGGGNHGHGGGYHGHGGGGHHGHGHKGHHSHQQHYHQHHQSGWGGWADEYDGWGWGDEGYEDPYEHYGGWESSHKDSYTSGENNNFHHENSTPRIDTNKNEEDKPLNKNTYGQSKTVLRESRIESNQYSVPETPPPPSHQHQTMPELPPFPVNFQLDHEIRNPKLNENYQYNNDPPKERKEWPRRNIQNTRMRNFGFENTSGVRNSLKTPSYQVASASDESTEIVTTPSNFFSTPFPTFEEFQRTAIK